MNADPRRARARAARNAEHGPALITAPPSSLQHPLTPELRTRVRDCPQCGSRAERFQPGVAHCTAPTCGAFWSTT